MNDMEKVFRDTPEILKTDHLETVSAGTERAAGNSGIPLPGVTMPTCTICGSKDTTCDVFKENGKWYKQYKCLSCGSYFSERQEVQIPDQMQVRPR